MYRVLTGGPFGRGVPIQGGKFEIWSTVLVKTVFLRLVVNYANDCSVYIVVLGTSTKAISVRSGEDANAVGTEAMMRRNAHRS